MTSGRHPPVAARRLQALPVPRPLPAAVPLPPTLDIAPARPAFLPSSASLSARSFSRYARSMSARSSLRRASSSTSSTVTVERPACDAKEVRSEAIDSVLFVRLPHDGATKSEAGPGMRDGCGEGSESERPTDLCKHRRDQRADELRRRIHAALGRLRIDYLADSVPESVPEPLRLVIGDGVRVSGLSWPAVEG